MHAWSTVERNVGCIEKRGWVSCCFPKVVRTQTLRRPVLFPWWEDGKTWQVNLPAPLTTFVTLGNWLTFLSYNFLFCKCSLPYSDFMQIRLDNVRQEWETRQVVNKLPLPGLYICLGGSCQPASPILLSLRSGSGHFCPIGTALETSLKCKASGLFFTDMHHTCSWPC